MKADELYPEIAEAVRKRGKEIEETSEIPEVLPPDTKPEMTAWQGAWLLIFTFFLAVTLAVTGLSLLFGGPSPFGAYWFFWGILALLVIIYPIALFIDWLIIRR